MRRAGYVCFMGLVWLSTSGAATEKGLPLFRGAELPKGEGPILPGLGEGPGKEKYRVWVQLRDKAVRKGEEFQVTAGQVLLETPPRTLDRRRKTLPQGQLVRWGDLPVPETYIKRILTTGAALRVRSRWFNAVSLEATRDQLARIARFPFVTRFREVAVGRSRPLPDSSVPLEFAVKAAPQGFDYGPSWDQNHQILVDELHQRGYSGAGVWVGVLDEGFAPFSVRCLDSTKIVATRDFVDGDDYPAETPVHGTSVLSVLGGFEEGLLIGPAFGATFLLARTEINWGIEVQQEEDLWIAALEWFELEGVDVVNSSVGYADWYGPGDYDGLTAPITLAADAAAERGVFIVNSAGNRGVNGLIAPADGFRVCSVGAVDSAGTPTSFSSRGPTSDGRIKPDVCAQGAGTVRAFSDFLESVCYDSSLDLSPGLTQVLTEFGVPSDSPHLWLNFQLADRSETAPLFFGTPVGEFEGGLEVRVRRDEEDSVVFRRLFSDPDTLSDPWPDGFGYAGTRVYPAGGGIESSTANAYEIALTLDLSPRLPEGGLLAGDTVTVHTSMDPTQEGKLGISFLLDSQRATYTGGSGTSYSAPLVAGAAALLLEVHPDWAPDRLLEALRSTASQSGSPDNVSGWGIVNASAASETALGTGGWMLLR